MNISLSRATIQTNFYAFTATRSGGPEMQFDVRDRHGARTYANLTIDDAKILRARLDEFIESNETVKVAVEARAHFIDVLRRNENLRVTDLD